MKKIVIVLMLVVVSSNLNAQKNKVKIKQKEHIAKIVQSYTVTNTGFGNGAGKPDARKRKS